MWQKTISWSFAISLFFSAFVSLSSKVVMADCAPTVSECGIIKDDIGANPNYCDTPSCDLPTYSACGSNNVGDRCCVGPQANLLCAVPTPTSVIPPTPTTGITSTPAPFTPYGPPTNETFDKVNPLLIGGGENIDDQEPSQYARELSTPGGIISRALTFIFPLAGLMLFALLVWGGFEMLAGSPTKKSMESGKQRLTAAIAGFFLLFAAYWIWQIVEIIFGVAIL